ncbi:MAG: nuclear transport factor 2 family protein [Cyclobacteriaceae bacterium]|nr:nuclear transport factor 2 family protein [Cyclobacteriaceae bacterium]MDX5465335.1 nuclear transport factor 2 family protein [Cyclobacteriaceae bacterium]
MKNVIAIILILLIAVSCQQQSRYTQQAPEIETVKALFAAYNSEDYEGQRQYYDPNVQIFINSPESSPTSLDENISQMMEEKDFFNNETITIEDDAIERVTTDDGEVWVNVWGEWKGNMASTGKEYVIPFHQTFQFVDGKIVKEYGYWDNSKIMEDMMKAEMESKSDTTAVQ